jgi:RNA pol II promoter Fmp27 protein domain
MSISLTSAVRRIKDKPTFSNFHLTPKAFAHFWHWWELFDGRLSLPIRQGSYYRHKLLSPKFGHHLATIKYRISIPHLFISHVYIDESRQAWSDGITRFVGVKALIDNFHADMHQRDQESTQYNPLLDATEVVHHKVFNAAEVVLRGLDLRAMLATFADPVKNIVFPEPCAGMSQDRIRTNLPVTDSESIWIDNDDFIEIDWRTSDLPKVNLLRTATCPHFTYFKRSVEKDYKDPHQRTEYSKFDTEDTHVCLLGKEPSLFGFSLLVPLLTLFPRCSSDTSRYGVYTNRGVASNIVRRTCIQKHAKDDQSA